MHKEFMVRQIVIIVLTVMVYVPAVEAQGGSDGVTTGQNISGQNISIEQLVEKVKESQGDARRKAMNNLKIKLRSVNQKTQAQTMRQLRKTFAGTHTQQRGATHTMHHTMQSRQHKMQQMRTQTQNPVHTGKGPGPHRPPVSPGGHP